MTDQAAALRNLVLRSSRQTRSSIDRPPRVAWIIGGRRGVGSTTIAVGTSVVAVEQGYRVVLVNASPDVAAVQRLAERPFVDEFWLADRREIHEVLVPGPWGLQIAANLGHSPQRPLSADEATWLHRQFCSLGKHADCVLIEGWPRHNETAMRLWELASQVIVVSTPDSRSIMHTYARIKGLVSQSRESAGWLLLNRTQKIVADAAVAQRLMESCEQFLNYRLLDWERVPDDRNVADWMAHPRGPTESVGRGFMGRMRRMAIELCHADTRGESGQGRQLNVAGDRRGERAA